MKKSLFLLPLVALIAVGCDRPAPEEPKDDVTLTLTTEDSLWFDAEGGEGAIGYTLEGADINQLKATASVDWITNITIGETVNYTVEANASEEDRSGVITLKCGDVEAKVAVMQYGKEETNVGEGLTTLKSDYNFDIEGGIFVGAYVGDLMGTGCNTCQVYMWEHLDLETGEEQGDTFQIDLQLPRGGTDICGTYTEGTAVGHFIPGSAEDLGGQFMQQNSWYITADYTNFAPMIRGTVKVESEDGINYTFTIDVKDDSGNAIRGTFKGYGEFTEW